MGNRTFKYQDIALSLEKRILSGDFVSGQPLPSEIVLSHQYGVNHLTVRKAMELLVRNGRVVRYPRRGTFLVEESIPGGKSCKKILYVGEIESHFFKELYLAILRNAQISGQRLATFNSALSKNSYRKLIKELKIRMEDADSVICNTSCLDAVCSLNRRNQKTIVLVDIYGYGSEPPPCYSISCNIFLAIRIATEHLIRLGHRKIAFVGAPDIISPISKKFRIPARSRLAFQGYAASFFMFNIQMPQNLAIGPLGESINECENSIASWLKTLREWPTAFVCEGDFRAAALIRAAAKYNQFAPKDFSIIGTGNTPWTEMTNPPLTSVYLGEREMAKMAILMAGQSPSTESNTVLVSPKLIIRNSTKVLK